MKSQHCIHRFQLTTTLAKRIKKPLQTYNDAAAFQRTRCRRTTASLRSSGPVVGVQRHF